MNTRKYPSDDRQATYEWQLWNGGAAVKLSAQQSELASFGHDLGQIASMMRTHRVAFAAEAYRYAEKEQGSSITALRLLSQSHYSYESVSALLGGIPPEEILSNLARWHQNDVERAKECAAHCAAGQYDSLAQLQLLLSYQVSPREISLQSGDIERFEKLQHIQHAQSLLDACRKGTTFMNGRELWQHVLQHNLEPEDIDSTQEEIRQLADASFRFGIKDSPDENPNFTSSETMD